MNNQQFFFAAIVFVCARVFSQIPSIWFGLCYKIWYGVIKWDEENKKEWVEIKAKVWIRN